MSYQEQPDDLFENVQETGLDASAEDTKARRTEKTGDPSAELDDLEYDQDVAALKSHKGPASNLRRTKPHFKQQDDVFENLVANAEREDFNSQN